METEMCSYYFSFLKGLHNVCDILPLRVCGKEGRLGAPWERLASHITYPVQSDGLCYANAHIEDISLQPLNHRIQNSSVVRPRRFK